MRFAAKQNEETHAAPGLGGAGAGGGSLPSSGGVALQMPKVV